MRQAGVQQIQNKTKEKDIADQRILNAIYTNIDNELTAVKKLIELYKKPAK